MRVADYIFQTLADRGVRNVFLVTGGGAMFLNDALGRERRINPVCCHHEQGAAIAAEGYARVTGELAVVSVTTGPGGTNALTGVIGEWLDSQPVLYLSGQVKYPTTVRSQNGLPLRQLGDQEIDIVEMVRGVTKYAAMVTDPRTIRRELEHAIRLATGGRPGPVWLDIPIDVQSAEIDPGTLDGWTEPEPEPEPEIPAGLIDSLQAAHAPVLIAGHGIRCAGAQREFAELVERLRIPVLQTFNGFDLVPTDSPYGAGRIGTIGTRGGNFCLQNADWVLCLGTRNNIRQVSYNSENFARNARDLIVVDIDPAELRKSTVRPTLAVRAELKSFLRALNRTLAERPGSGPDRSGWLAWCRERQRRYPAVLPEYRGAPNGINPYVFTEMLCARLPGRATVACTNATPSLALFQAGIVKAGQRQFANSGCAAMGYGLPAALGAAVARPDRLTACLEGDGSLMMNLQELQTIRARNLNLKLFLYNNGEYCSIRQTQDNFFGRRTGCTPESGVTFPDWEKLAAAFAWPYFRIDSDAAAEGLLPEILETAGPVFIDVRLTPGYAFAPKLASRRGADGALVSPSLEDMFPFLSRAEMEQNRYFKQ